MLKTQAYHEAAIQYNEGLAERAEEMVDDLGHEEVQRWSRAVAKQHRFHAKRHQSALDKLLAQPASEQEEEPETDKHNLISADQEEPVAVLETPIIEETEIIEEGPEGLQEDGCINYHNPSDPNCAYYPEEVKNGGNQEA